MKRPKSRIQKRVERQKRKARYGPRWDEIRKLVYKRDGHRCRACGATNTKLNAHHILLLKVSKTNDDRNLITLCDRCHKMIESKALKLLKEGGHRKDIVRLTHRWLLEMNNKYKNGNLLNG
jgi:5-methylcytosine-specific restriction endonuclease McrA